MLLQQQQQQEQQQQQQQQEQREQMELQNLIAQTSPNNTLSSLQQQLDAGSAHMGNTNSLSSSSSLIHELPGVSNPLTAFLHRNSLTSLHDPLQGGSLQNAQETNFSNSRGGGRGGGGGLHHSHQQQQQHQQTLPPQQQRQQQQSFGGVGGGSHSGGASHQNSPTNSISSLQNSLSSFSGTGLAGSLLNRNLLSAGALQQNSASAVGMASLLEQQQQQSLQSGQQGSQQQQHQDTQNVVNHLLQEMMMNQQHMYRATSSSFQQQALGAVSGLDGGNQGMMNAATQGFSGSMNSFTVTAAGGGAAHAGTGIANLGVGSMNGVISNQQLGSFNNSSSNNNLGGLAGALSNSSTGGGGGGGGGGGVNTTVAAAAGLGNNYSLRNSESGLSSLGGLVSGGNVAAGAAAPINTLNGRLMLAGIGQQQQQQQMQDLSHPSHHHHHELAGTVSGLLGDGLSTASGFAATQFNWSKTP